jgi:biotin-(acetyl-CoA carboxylase) ligase
VQDARDLYKKIRQKGLDPNDIHSKLLKHFENIKVKAVRGSWADIWYRKYQYFKEVGDEIKIRKDGGKSVQEIMARLEAIRLSIRDRRSIKVRFGGEIRRLWPRYGSVRR